MERPGKERAFEKSRQGRNENISLPGELETQLKQVSINIALLRSYVFKRPLRV